MLIKLNEGEGLTIKANHSDESNSYVVSNINGKYLRMREFPSGDIPPKSEQGDSKNSSATPVQQLKTEIAALATFLSGLTNIYEPKKLVDSIVYKLQQLSAL